MGKAFGFFVKSGEEFVAVLLFVLMIVVVFLQVGSRIFFSPLVFTEEIARYLFLWLVYMGFAYGTKNTSHIRLEFLTAKLKGRRKFIFDIALHILTVATMAYLLYSSILYIKFSWIIRSPTMDFSVGIIYLVAPIAFTATIVRCVEQIVRECRSLKSKEIERGENSPLRPEKN